MIFRAQESRSPVPTDQEVFRLRITQIAELLMYNGLLRRLPGNIMISALDEFEMLCGYSNADFLSEKVMRKLLSTWAIVLMNSMLPDKRA